MRMLLWFAAIAGWTLVSAGPLLAADNSLEVTVKAGKYDRTNTPVTVLINAPADAKSATLTDPAGKKITGQLTAPGLRSGEAKGKTELHFILPSLKQGETLTLKADFSSTAVAKGFAWKMVPDEYAELSRDDKPVVRYMCIKLTDKNRNEAGKVYHHFYDPAGTRLITKGPGGLYPHHRGLFFGYVNITYEGGHADTWYANGTPEVHTAHLAQEAGPVLGRHLAAVDWVGSDKKAFIKENRELAVYSVPGGAIIDFTSRLASTNGKVKLDGNAPHAGFHFRADQEVAAKTKGQTYYLRARQQGRAGEGPRFGQGRAVGRHELRAWRQALHRPLLRPA